MCLVFSEQDEETNQTQPESLIERTRLRTTQPRIHGPIKEPPKYDAGGVLVRDRSFAGAEYAWRQVTQIFAEAAAEGGCHGIPSSHECSTVTRDCGPAPKNEVEKLAKKRVDGYKYLGQQLSHDQDTSLHTNLGDSNSPPPLLPPPPPTQIQEPL